MEQDKSIANQTAFQSDCRIDNEWKVSFAYQLLERAAITRTQREKGTKVL